MPEVDDGRFVPDDDGRFVPDDDSTVLGCDVSCDREGYWVELTIGFSDDVVRRRIGPYLTERIARVAAGQIRRAAGRSGPPPTGL
jgi:hypothetical protein